MAGDSAVKVIVDIVGGGPSIKGNEHLIDGDWRVFLNNAFQGFELRPSDIIFSIDPVFWRNFEPPFKFFNGYRYVCRGQRIERPDIEIMHLKGASSRFAWTQYIDEGVAWGKHSGFAALHYVDLASGLLPIDLVRLWGYDYCRGPNGEAWHHDGYPWMKEPTPVAAYEHYLEDFEHAKPRVKVQHMLPTARFRERALLPCHRR